MARYMCHTSGAQKSEVRQMANVSSIILRISFQALSLRSSLTMGIGVGGLITSSKGKSHPLSKALLQIPPIWTQPNLFFCLGGVVSVRLFIYLFILSFLGVGWEGGGLPFAPLILWPSRGWI